jgi:hypothetical protein
MVEMVRARRGVETKEDRRDLFTGLLDAVDNDRDVSEAMTEPELICKFQSSYRLSLMKMVLTRYPSEYVRLPSRWT